MKYYIQFSCGHKATVELFGKSADRDKKIRYFEEQGVCPDCYREQKEIERTIGRHEVVMPYKEYKEKYPNFPTKNGSYNFVSKTIVVYIPDV